MRVSIASPLMLPSPFDRRVGIRIVTFKACSGFTHVTARRIAQPPKAAFVTRLQPCRLPDRTARQLPDQSTTLWVESSSTSDPRLRGALPNADSRTATNSPVFDHLVGEQQDRFRDGEPERLARGFKPDIRNPVALAPAQAGLFILALEGCRRASKQRRFYILKCVHADDGVEAAVDSAGDHRHHATPGAHVKLGSL